MVAIYFSCCQLSCSQVNIFVPVLSKMSLPTVRTLPSYFFHIHFNITLHLLLSLTSGFFSLSVSALRLI